MSSRVRRGSCRPTCLPSWDDLPGQDKFHRTILMMQCARSGWQPRVGCSASSCEFRKKGMKETENMEDQRAKLRPLVWLFLSACHGLRVISSSLPPAQNEKLSSELLQSGTVHLFSYAGTAFIFKLRIMHTYGSTKSHGMMMCIHRLACSVYVYG